MFFFVIALFFMQVNTWGNVVYDEYVRPIERVVDFRTKISGIHPSHLKKGLNSGPQFFYFFIFYFCFG